MREVKKGERKEEKSAKSILLDLVQGNQNVKAG